MIKAYKKAVISSVLTVCILLTLSSCAKTDKTRTLTFASWYTEKCHESH